MPHKPIFLRLNLTPEQLAPALVGRPEGGFSLNHFSQLGDEVHILETMETLPISGIGGKDHFGPKIREIIVNYDFTMGGFIYGIRDHVIHQLGSEERNHVQGEHLDTKAIAVAEASYTSLDIWKDWVPQREDGEPDFRPYER